MKREIKGIICTIVMLCMIIPSGSYANSGQEILIGENGKIFKNITISLKGNRETNEYYMCRAMDIGIFKKTEGQWEKIFAERKLFGEVSTSNFGDKSNYKGDSIYAIGYRPIYQIMGNQTNVLTEGNWEIVKDSNFRKVIPVEITAFTDRITASNSWMTDKEAKDLNWYNLNSRVISKIEFRPEEKLDIEKYIISVNANSEEHSQIEIKEGKIRRIEIGGEKILEEIIPIETSKYELVLTEEQKKKPITIYYEYAFDKKETVTEKIEDFKLKNTVSITPVVGMEEVAVVKAENLIQVKDINIIYR